MPIPEKYRAYAYRVIVALAPIAVLYGVVNETEVAVWLALVAAVLGNGLAVVHTSTKV